MIATGVRTFFYVHLGNVILTATVWTEAGKVLRHRFHYPLKLRLLWCPGVIITRQLVLRLKWSRLVGIGLVWVCKNLLQGEAFMLYLRFFFQLTRFEGRILSHYICGLTSLGFALSHSWPTGRVSSFTFGS